MTTRQKRVFSGTLAAGITSTTAVPQKSRMQSVTVYNPTVSTVEFELYLVNSGGTAGSGNKFVTRLIAPKQTIQVNEVLNQILEASDLIGLSGTGLNVSISTVDIFV